MEELLNEIKKRFGAKEKIIEEQKELIGDLRTQIKQMQNKININEETINNINRKWKKAKELFSKADEVN